MLAALCPVAGEFRFRSVCEDSTPSSDEALLLPWRAKLPSSAKANMATAKAFFFPAKSTKASDVARSFSFESIEPFTSAFRGLLFRFRLVVVDMFGSFNGPLKNCKIPSLGTMVWYGTFVCFRHSLPSNMLHVLRSTIWWCHFFSSKALLVAIPKSWLDQRK